MGRPLAGLRMFWVDIIRTRASIWAMGRQGHVHGHLVAVEVGVERGADQGVQPDGLAFHQDRLERLDAQAVQGGRPVEQHRVVLDHFVQHVPDFRHALLDHLLGLADGGGVALVLQPIENEGLEQFQGHLLGQPALVQLEVGAHHDDRAAGVVHPLAQQVLAEPALLALEGVAEGLQRTVGDAAQQPAALAVLEQGVHGLLQHALLVAHDHFGGAQLQELLQPVVAVDDPAVQVVQIGGGEPAAVQGHQRAQFGGQHRDHVQDHPLGLVAQRLKASVTFSRLAIFTRFWVEVSAFMRWRSSMASASTSTCLSSSLMASAPIWARKRSPYST